ncbi:MAG: hypothetical protein WBO31_01540 [Saprospiraceae bacterium]
MKGKILNLLLIVSSMMGYLEWGKDQKVFLFQMEAEIVSKIFSAPGSVIHPFTILPLIGQLILLFTLFQKQPGRILTFIGIGGIGILLVFMSVVGIISLNFKIFISTIPFIVIGVLAVYHHWKMKPLQSDT